MGGRTIEDIPLSISTKEWCQTIVRNTGLSDYQSDMHLTQLPGPVTTCFPIKPLCGLRKSGLISGVVLIIDCEQMTEILLTGQRIMIKCIVCKNTW